jgi:hypothetical protein
MTREQPGNAMASQAEFERQMVRLATQLLRFEQVITRMDEGGTWITGLSIKVPGEDRADYLVVVRARTSAGSVVGFAGGDTLAEAIRVTCAKLENRSMRWREDQYAD